MVHCSVLLRAACKKKEWFLYMIIKLYDTRDAREFEMHYININAPVCLK